MATVVKSFSISGIDGYPVDIEASVLDGDFQKISIIGLGDTAIKESVERIRSAITDCNFSIPDKKIVLSLAPGDRKKRGTHFDLPLSLALLARTGAFKPKHLSRYGFLGELSLGGDLRACSGILPMILAAKQNGIRNVIVPMANYPEARLVSDVRIYGFNNLKEVTSFLEGKSNPPELPGSLQNPLRKIEEITYDFSDVRGQSTLIDAVVLAASGGHNMLMIGNPGCGKTMIAQRIPSILPTMNEEEALEITKIHSISGLLSPGEALLKNRPFRSPHHNVSVNALIGGGANALPGEISLAHNGVLFLDELGEFSRSALDALRQPLEDKSVTISRVNYSNRYPANFMLVSAMNPCPCGFYPGPKCRCSDYEIVKYRSKISGPVLDRIDIQKHVLPVDLFDSSAASSPSSKELRDRVERARKIQHMRFSDFPLVNCNAQMTGGMIKEFCELDSETTSILQKACDRFGYSARVIHKLLRMARTNADLSESPKIRKEDVTTVLHCRDLDKSNGMMSII